MQRHTSHVTRHTSHVTRHTSHVTRHTSHVSQSHAIFDEDGNLVAPFERVAVPDTKAEPSAQAAPNVIAGILY
jgi:N-methylhydantoinase B/oxoprolinase/acetone carboxylase alpha subunit